MENSQTMDKNFESPPSYSATSNINMTERGEKVPPPPSYDSLYGKMKAAKEESSGNMDMCKKFYCILCGSIVVTIILAVSLALPIAMIVMGAIHKDDCPAERYIPIYLIVGGSFAIVKNVSSLIQRCLKKDEENSDEQKSKPNPFDGAISCFLFAWFIAGNVWVYGTTDRSTDPTASNYCDQTLYLFAFWVITATYIIIGATCFCLCFGGIMCICCGIFSSKESSENQQ